MQRRFVPLDADLFSHVRQLRPDGDTLVVVPNNAAVSALQRHWRQHDDTPAPDILSLVQLKELLLRPTLALIPAFLRQQVVAALMDDELRQQFHVYGEESLRRFTDRFFWLFESFREQRVSHRVDWDKLDRGGAADSKRRHMWDMLLSLRERYARELTRLGLTDVCLLGAEPRFDNFRWRRCFMVNLLRATPLEREMLHRVDAVCETTALLQGPQGWFEGDRVLVDPFTHPPQARTQRLDILRAPDETTLLLAALTRLDTTRNTLFFDDAFEQRPLAAHVRTNLLGRARRRLLRQSSVYRLLRDLMDIVEATGKVAGEWLVEAAAMEHALDGPVGEAWFGDDATNVWRTVNSLRNKQFYLHADLRELPGADELARFLKRLRAGISWLELCDWLWAPPLPPDAMTAKEWEAYFDTLGSFIASVGRTGEPERPLLALRRFIDLLGAASVSAQPNHGAPWRLHKMEDALASPQTDACACIDLVEGRYPASAAPAMLFTQQELTQLGFDNLETTRQWQRYAFWRAMCQSQTVLLAPRENIDQNVTPSGLIEETLLWAQRHSVTTSDETISPGELDMREVARVLRGDVSPWAGRHPDRLAIPVNLREDSGKGVYLSPSSAPGAKPNPAAFFLRVCARLRKRDPVERMDARLVGDIMHKIVEQLVRTTPQDRLDKLLSDKPALLETLQQLSADIWRPDAPGAFHLRASDGFERVFFDEIMQPFALRNTAELLAGLAQQWEGESAVLSAEVSGEKALSDMIPFKLVMRGRADLVAETERRRWIVDFKSGGGADPPFEQLRAYETLFACEKEIESRFAYIMTQGIVRPPATEPAVTTTLAALLARVVEEGAWRAPDKPGRYDDYTELYRLDLPSGDGEEA